MLAICGVDLIKFIMHNKILGIASQGFFFFFSQSWISNKINQVKGCICDCYACPRSFTLLSWIFIFFVNYVLNRFILGSVALDGAIAARSASQGSRGQSAPVWGFESNASDSHGTHQFRGSSVIFVYYIHI